MAEQTPEKKETLEEKLQKLRSMSGKIIIGLLVVSGWVFFFSQTPQTVAPTDKPAAEKNDASGRPPGFGEEKTEGTFVVSYTLVLLSIGLALMFVTHPSNRRERFRPQQYSAINVEAKK
jgi:hypothetical protein